MYTIAIHENAQTYTAHVEVDQWDNERITCSLWDVNAQSVCIAVGDGACSDSAIEDALWGALLERAHQRHETDIAALRSEMSVGITRLRLTLRG